MREMIRQDPPGTLLSAEFHQRAEAARFGISLEAFNQLLMDIFRRYFESGSSPAEIVQFLRKLHLKDLALAHSCARGNEKAWEYFFTRYGTMLHWAACKIVNDQLRARELADTVCADLFSTSSKLASYSGRGPLDAWLKVNLIQANIDSYRTERRFISFDDITESASQLTVFGLGPDSRKDERMESSLKDAMSELAPQDRFILASYFLDKRNLAQIAAVLRVHESTVSRKLDRALKRVRKSLVCKLRDCGLSQESIADTLRETPQEVSFDIRAQLLFGLESIKGHS